MQLASRSRTAAAAAQQRERADACGGGPARPVTAMARGRLRHARCARAPQLARLRSEGARERAENATRNVLARALAVSLKIWLRGGKKVTCGKMQKKYVFMAGIEPAILRVSYANESNFIKARTSGDKTRTRPNQGLCLSVRRKLDDTNTILL